jgi:Spy/CpxP family protein refolding chaperone
MKKQVLSAAVIAALAACYAVNALAGEQSNSAPSQQRAQGWDDYGRELRNWFNRWWDGLGTSPTRGERPLISLMLRNREKLGLSDDQVRRMEQMRADFEKESIRKEADLRVANLDLDALLDATSLDMPKVEAKVREIEKNRADLRLARIRTIEKAKELLTPDQRKKLQEILTEPGFPHLLPRREREE